MSKEIEILQWRSNRKMLEEVAKRESKVQLFKRRMLEWQNPVEYVNNMYGCHPDDNGSDYFKTVYAD